MKRFILTVIATMLLLVNFGSANAQASLLFKGMKVISKEIKYAKGAFVIGMGVNAYLKHNNDRLLNRHNINIAPYYINKMNGGMGDTSKKEVVMVDASKMKKYIINGLKSANTTLTNINTNVTRTLYVCFQHIFTSLQHTRK